MTYVISSNYSKEQLVVVLGVILLILGLVIPMSLLTWLGVVLIVVGLVLNFVPVGGSTRRIY